MKFKKQLILLGLLCFPCLFFSQEKSNKLFPFADEIYVSINTNNSRDHNPNLGFGAGLNYKLVQRPKFSFFIGLDYFHTSVFVDNINASKKGFDGYRDTEFKFNSLTVPFMMRHQMGNKFSLTIDYGIHLGITSETLNGNYILFDWMSSNSNIKELNNETDYFFIPNIHLGVGFKFPVSSYSIILSPYLRLAGRTADDYWGNNKVSLNHFAISLRLTKNNFKE